MTPIETDLAKLLSDSLQKAFGGSFPLSEAETLFKAPREEKFGDLTTPIVLKLSKERKLSPRPSAEALLKYLEAGLDTFSLRGRISKITVEDPGFINFYFSNREIASVILKIKKEGSQFGKPKITHKKKILLEFVSANPTGPLTVAHGRQAALGDSLARILKFCGHEVTKEYYNNDEGVQIHTLGASTLLRLKEIVSGHSAGELPENYYQGAYLIEIAGQLLKREPQITKLPEPKQLEKSSQFAKDEIMKGIKRDLADFDVNFDNYYSQEALAKSGKVEQTLGDLKSKNVLYESEGALWFRSTDFGDDKDRVLIKSDKSYTYFTPDIAYHQDKFRRGFDELIDILGPDHHGYIARLKASQTALGKSADQIHVLIAQLVTLFEGTRQVRMSTRAGEFVTLRQILDEVGKDAGRFFFVMRKFDAHLDFDLALAKSQTPENPVFYIQYAHARVESIKNQAKEKNIEVSWSNTTCLSKLSNPMEIRILRILSQFEASIMGAEKTLEPYRLVPYLMDLAGSFHRFYAENRVICDDAELIQARMMLAIAVQTVIRTGLELLGVSAPLKM
ncbi:MAG: arginine--tRNA ligase [Candidatus Omnitrophica bacterium CG1_02_46_14]|nr:MAG: arginine--tRNA ligase [Candidatus Omnitrophica bacterium CG1_02_46_14]